MAKRSPMRKTGVVGPIITEDGEEEFIVERIVKKKMVESQPFYLVKWLGWPDEENTWEPIENLTHSKDALAEFEKNLGKQEESSKTGGKKKAKKSLENGKSFGSVSKGGGKSIPSTQKVMVTDEECDDEREKIEIEAQMTYSPLFQLALEEWENPLAILGSSVDDEGNILHLVRLRPQNEREAEEVARDPCAGVSADNVRIIVAQFMNECFPEIVAKYYEDNSLKVYNAKDDDSVDKLAAMRLLEHNLKKVVAEDGKNGNAEEKGEDVVDTIDGEAAAEIDDGGTRRDNPEDMFGLPKDYSSSDLETYESSSSSDEYEQIE